MPRVPVASGLPDFPWDSLAPYRARAAEHPGGVVDLAVGTPVDDTPDLAREALAAGHVPGGSRRNLDWVRPHLAADGIGEDELILLADAQTSGGLLVVGEVPGAPVVGETVAAGSLGDGVLVQVS